MKVLFDFSKEQNIVLNNHVYGFSYDILNTISNFKDDLEIFVVVVPGSYIGIRKSLSIAYAIEMAYNISIFGISILDYLSLYGSSVAYIQGKHVWYKQNQIITLGSIDNYETMDVSNIYISDKTTVIDVSSDKIFNSIDHIPKLEAKQVFFDSWIY